MRLLVLLLALSACGASWDDQPVPNHDLVTSDPLFKRSSRDAGADG